MPWSPCVQARRARLLSSMGPLRLRCRFRDSASAWYLDGGSVEVWHDDQIVLTLSEEQLQHIVWEALQRMLVPWDRPEAPSRLVIPAPPKPPVKAPRRRAKPT
jgi:hypothetical protein